MVTTVEGIPSETAKPFQKRAVVIKQKHCEFIPHASWIEVDTEIRFKSSDATPHNVYGKAEAGSVFNMCMPVKDKVIGKRLRAPDIIALECDAGHVWISAFTIFASHPYIAIAFGLTARLGRAIANCLRSTA